MIRLVAELAEARNRVDRAIALGSFIPRLKRLRAFGVLFLAGLCTFLITGYIHMSQEIGNIKENQAHAKAASVQAEKERKIILNAVTGSMGKIRAVPPPTP